MYLLHADEYMSRVSYICRLSTRSFKTGFMHSPLLRCGPSSCRRYPPAFVAYLARLLLARDERCAGWWAGAKSDAWRKKSLSQSVQQLESCQTEVIWPVPVVQGSISLYA